ncbi:MAG: glycosyltransferase family 39 protein [Kiritimatiellia bacterium]
MKCSVPRVCALTLLIILSLLAFRHCVAVLRFPYPLEYGEGVNLLWSQRAGAGLDLYPLIRKDRFPHIHHPYPPVSAWLTAGLVRAGVNTHPFLAGRWVSMLGMSLAALSLFTLLRRRTDAVGATVGTLVFLLSPMILQFGPLMRVDALALGFSLCALMRLERTPRSLISAAIFASLAFLVKPSYIAAAVVVGICALRENPIRKAVPVVLAGLLPIVLVLGSLLIRETPSLWQHLWRFQRLPPDFPALVDWLSRFAGRHSVILAVGGIGAWMSVRRRRGPVELYTLFIPIAPLLTVAVAGSQENYLMEVWAIACLYATGVWMQLRARFEDLAWTALLIPLLLFLPVAPAPVFTRTYGQELADAAGSAWTPTRADRETGRLLLEELRTAEGPVLGADPGFLLAAGHEILYQPFQYQRLSQAGIWKDTHLHLALEDDWFSHVLLKGMADTAGDAQFSAETQILIDRHYELHRVLGPWRLYRRAL